MAFEYPIRYRQYLFFDFYYKIYENSNFKDDINIATTNIKKI
jgi:hypothetical protein